MNNKSLEIKSSERILQEFAIFMYKNTLRHLGFKITSNHFNLRVFMVKINEIYAYAPLFINLNASFVFDGKLAKIS